MPVVGFWISFAVSRAWIFLLTRSADVHRLLRFARTVAGISAEQLWFQCVRRAQGVPRPRVIDVAPAPQAFWDGLRDVLRATAPPEHWDGDSVAADAMNGRWILLNETLGVGADLDWSQRHGRPLLSFHLQYHEPLRALARRFDRSGDPRALASIVTVLTRWIETTAAGKGDAWHPYPISVRVFVWFEVLALVGRQLPAEARHMLEVSLASQLDVLARRRERQIGANHLQRNDAALALGGLGFTGTRAAEWRTVGLKGTWGALQHHVLDDGMHFERSPMYHAGMFGDVLRVIECCQVAGAAVPDAARTRVGLMATALRRMTRSDGSLHQFNDTADGIAPPSAWLLERAARVSQSAGLRAEQGDWVLPDAGYAGWQDPAAGTHVVFDAGAAGPREQPGHAHCDALSFELCVDGQPVLVNAGVHGYDQDPYREYSRSTRGHNTVQIGRLEQHEIWATFRVARFGAVDGPIVRTVAPWCVSGSVIGYAGGTHSRRLEMLSAHSLRITDSIEGDAGDIARARLLFHPSCDVQVDGDTVVAQRGVLVVRLRVEHGLRVRLVRGAESPAEGWYFPTFGVAKQATCVVVDIALPAAPVVTTITWGAR